MLIINIRLRRSGKEKVSDFYTNMTIYKYILIFSMLLNIFTDKMFLNGLSF